MGFSTVVAVPLNFTTGGRVQPPSGVPGGSPTDSSGDSNIGGQIGSLLDNCSHGLPGKASTGESNIGGRIGSSGSRADGAGLMGEVGMTSTQDQSLLDAVLDSWDRNNT